MAANSPSKIKNEVLFGSSLESSSNYIYQIIKSNRSLNYKLFTSGVGSNLFNEKKIKIDHADLNLKDLKEQLIDFNPKLIFVVPQYNNSLEKKLMLLGNLLKFTVLSAIDHWFPILERFEYTYLYRNRLLKKKLISDFIIVNDKSIKKKLSIRFNKKIIKVFGNPILENRWSNINKRILKKKFKSRIFTNRKTILFISEPLTDINKIYKKIINYGFNEFEVLRDLIDISKNNFNIIIKLHPSENKNKYIKFEKKYDFLSLIHRENIDDVILNCEKIVGMGSLLLIESGLIRRDILSYRPKEINSFIGNNKKITKLIKDKKSLKKEIWKQSAKIYITNNEYLSSTYKINNFIEFLLNK